MKPHNGMLAPDPSTIARHVGHGVPRLLVHGAMGTGKSTLAAALARIYAARGRVLGIDADPGSPAFGVPGTVSLGEWRDGAWQCLDSRPLGTLDAVRFRLPLVLAVTELLEGLERQALIVDGPGVVRGVGGAELLQGLAAAAEVETVLRLCRDADQAPLGPELTALPCRVVWIRAHPESRRPPRRLREAGRTRAWDTHLAGAVAYELDLAGLALIGTPPPRGSPDAWLRRQVALLRRAEPRAFGEIERFDGERVTVRLPRPPQDADTLLVRDAQRDATGTLVTAPPLRPAGVPSRDWRQPRAGQVPVCARVDGIGLGLVNGVFGDPLLDVQLANVRGRVLLDLGDAVRLMPRQLHAVRHVFVSHAHFDHIGGFPTLLRARLSGDPPPCRIYGPPGIRDHIAGFVAGVRWDRIGAVGPEFLVAECSPGRLDWSRVQPGQGVTDLGSQPAEGGVLLEENAFSVRAVFLDHGIPVLAFAVELAPVMHVRGDRLARAGLRPGPWIGELKARLRAGDLGARIELPDGDRERVETLRDALVDVAPGTRVVYATDLADSPANRRTLAALARAADLLVCEATFLEEDRDQAAATGHLTTTACVEIALEAEVRRLLPFHFSRRYSRRLGDVYAEIARACRGTPLARSLVASS